MDVANPSAPTEVRLAELLAVLSLGADLGMNQPMEHALRQCLLALRIGERLGLGEADRAVLYYVSLIAWVGCHIDAYEQAKWFGDDLVLKGDFRRYDVTGLDPLKFMATHLGYGRPLRERARVAVTFLGEGMRAAGDMLANHWYAADDLAGRVGLGDDVRRSLSQTFERWDGRGVPGELQGEQILMTARIVNLADVLEVFHRQDGIESAVAVARDRSGTQFDPGLVKLVCAEAPLLFADLEAVRTWDVVIAAEPALGGALAEHELDIAFEAIADFTDIKSPYTLGHSRAVARLAAAAGEQLGLDHDEVTTLRRAALVHDLGRLGVSNAVWDKPGELTAAEAERVRLHPYLSDRMLSLSPTLRELGRLAGQHHERVDGSGYPAGLSGAALSPASRVLAAADAYRTKVEPRPHRAALTAADAAALLRAEVRAGRLDGPSVDAVLRAAGHPPTRRTEWPAGLTAREVEVLRLVARGLSNAQIAQRLSISPKTAGNHIEHIYTKIGVSNRARAGLFATKHGLMSDA